ncbi:AfsR/SARP family transcriptional regulator [Amycolatopsis cihanbeyliensis]|uniref:DNA-binding SARP family transcriptional activator n=1 Tax=Amycolatopsis cihanbeyliensis TaxID=1128664 RepID=A0A542DPX1_AMYCI|nr:AfsR/SARP family transcriptional regulator [Amycolatopsis cihanbeyliensis]TQJ05151.1 DNA-binding SARP family transcriptional activator [Amycolatopsis cihanbeyliensis]
MEIKVLGTLDAVQNGASIAPTASKPRQLLALLALQSGHVVTASTLLDELWGTAPPRSALTTLQTYVCHLRKRVETAGHPAVKDVLVTTYGGYLLNVQEVAVDVHSYEHLAERGHRALEAGRLEQGSDLLRSALGVWRGPALSDVRIGIRLAMEVTRLEESKLGVLEALMNADLRLGRHQVLLDELAKLTEQHPMHENFCAQRMIALYRCGERRRALEAYRLLHDNLIDRLGLTPSERLRRLRQAILHTDPGLSVPA